MKREQILIDALERIEKICLKDAIGVHSMQKDFKSVYEVAIEALSLYPQSPSEGEEKDIDTEINNTMFMTGGNTDAEKSFYAMGAKFGYSLSVKEIEERPKVDWEMEYWKQFNENDGLTKEIERLKGLIEKAYHDGWMKLSYEEFKTKNNL